MIPQLLLPLLFLLFLFVLFLFVPILFLLLFFLLLLLLLLPTSDAAQWLSTASLFFFDLRLMGSLPESSTSNPRGHTCRKRSSNELWPSSVSTTLCPIAAEMGPPMESGWWAEGAALLRLGGCWKDTAVP